MVRVSIIVSAVLMLGAACAGAAESPFNVDVFFGWGNCYRPMEWTPVEVGISSTLTEPFAGTVTVSAQQDGLNNLYVSHAFVLTPDMPLHLPLVTKLSFTASKCTVRLTDDRGRTQWDNDFELWDFSAQNRFLTVVEENDLLIGLVGNRKFGLMQLSKESACRSDKGPGTVHLKDKLPRGVPWDWTGFVSLDLLILYDPDWSLFNPNQLKAISQWVSNGGRLLLVLGSSPMSSDNPIVQMLPFEISQPAEAVLDGPTLEQWGLSGEKDEDIVGRQVRARPNARFCEIEQWSEGLFATAFVGFGRVGVVGFDPAATSDRQKANSTQFWIGRIKAVLEDSTMPTSSSADTKAVKKPKPASAGSLTGDLVHPDRDEGGLELTFGGLAGGDYVLTSYHNNPARQHCTIDVYANGERKSSDNRQLQGNRDKSVRRVSTNFTVSDGGDAVIEFRPSPSSPFDKRAVLCGFMLTKILEKEHGSRRLRRDVLSVDFGATGQEVKDGYTPLGIGADERTKVARFTETDGLPEGITVTVKPTNPDDELQFNPTEQTLVRSQAFAGGRMFEQLELSPIAFSNRTIVFADQVEDQEQDRFSQYQYNISRAQIGSNAVIDHLYRISELRPLSIWWVILLLTLLAILLGPVDYKILKSRGKLPLTWVTCTFWIVVFTAGAYYGVQALRGGTMKCRVVSVLDGVEQGNRTWSTMYAGVFAPRSDDYRLNGLGEDQWWSGIAPTEENIHAYNRQTSTRNIYCYQHDGANVPHSVPINIWTMQCLLNESSAGELPVRAEVSRRGGKAAVKISNLSDTRLKGGYVLFEDNEALEFEDVAAGDMREFSGQLAIHKGWDLETDFQFDGRMYMMRGGRRHGPQSEFKRETAFSAQGSLRRTQTMKAYMARGAAVVHAEFEDAPVTFGIKGRSCDYNHIQLVRLVVFPKSEIEGRQND